MAKLNNKKGNGKKNNPGYFIKLMEVLISDLPNRSQKIIRDRFGVSQGEPKTLESIGQEYQITRERVRQIIKEGVRKISEKSDSDEMKEVEGKIKFTLQESNGIMTKEDLLNKLADDDKKEKGAILFFLQSLKGVNEIEDKNEIEKSFTLEGFNLYKWRKVKNAAKDLLKKEKSTLSEDEFYDKFSIKSEVDKQAFFNFLAASREIKKNNFGKWGLAGWSEISPKGTREKSYLVMKEIGKPLHFKDVARLIDEHKLNKRKTHPQTVHNELIKDKRFVLIGRGTYALTEWGYRRGTVKDVLEDILSKSERPLTKEEILERVMSARKVKKSTIMINLNNFFVRVDGNKYTVRDKKQKEENRA